jgi:hypothetical protein
MINTAAGIKNFQILNFYKGIFLSENIVKTSLGQPSLQRHLAALKSWPNTIS